jgi:hypothetical protein
MNSYGYIAWLHRFTANLRFLETLAETILVNWTPYIPPSFAQEIIHSHLPFTGPFTRK